MSRLNASVGGKSVFTTCFWPKLKQLNNFRGYNKQDYQDHNLLKPKLVEILFNEKISHYKVL